METYRYKPTDSPDAIRNAYKALPANVRERLVNDAPELCEDCHGKALGQAWVLIAIASLSGVMDTHLNRMETQINALRSVTKNFLPARIRW